MLLAILLTLGAASVLTTWSHPALASASFAHVLW
jgi:hypothetical protein